MILPLADDSSYDDWCAVGLAPCRYHVVMHLQLQHRKSSAVILALPLDEAVNTASVTSLTFIPGEANRSTLDRPQPSAS